MFKLVKARKHLVRLEKDLDDVLADKVPRGHPSGNTQFTNEELDEPLTEELAIGTEPFVFFFPEAEAELSMRQAFCTAL